MLHNLSHHVSRSKHVAPIEQSIKKYVRKTKKDATPEANDRRAGLERLGARLESLLTLIKGMKVEATKNTTSEELHQNLITLCTGFQPEIKAPADTVYYVSTAIISCRYGDLSNWADLLLPGSSHSESLHSLIGCRGGIE